MKQALLGFLAGALVTCVALTWFGYYSLVVRTSEGLRVVNKIEGNFGRLYIDVREWGALDYARNRDVSEALAADGWAQAKDALGSAVNQAQQSLQDAAGKLRKQLGQ